MEDLMLEYMDQTLLEINNSEQNDIIDEINSIIENQQKEIIEENILFESCALDILNETADEETLKKIRDKAAKKVSESIAMNSIQYDNLKLSISKDKKTMAEYYARMAAAGLSGGALGVSSTTLGAALGGASKYRLAAGAKGGVAGTLVATTAIIGGRAIYALIQKKRYDELCVIKLTGEKANKKGEKKEKCLGIWITIKISKNDLDPSVRSKVKIV